MEDVNDSRSIYRDLLIALGVLTVILGGLFLWISLRSSGAEEPMAYADPNVPAPVMNIVIEEEPEPATTVVEEETEEIPRYLVDTHVVVEGESFSLITGTYWEDIYLWPDLYVHNDMRSEDPDLIFPDEVVDIYNRLGHGDNYSEAEKGIILEAYIQVYDRYKALGPEKNDSAWTLLWCGAKYDHDFLELYAHRIDPADRAVAERYIAEEGFLD